MYRRPRIIPCLTLQHNDVVKTIGFKKPRYIGDPVNSVRLFNNKGIDEMLILDIRATIEHENPDIQILEEIASEAFMPLGYGGGVRNAEMAKEIFKIGYEKVAINSLLFDDPDEVRQVVGFAGSQSVIASIDYYKDIFGRIRVMTHDGKDCVGISLKDAIRNAIELGAGEILLTSIANDGNMKGYDTDTIKEMSDIVTVPMVANGGAGKVSDIKAALDAGANAVAAGSMFLYFGEIKAVLINTPDETEYYGLGIYAD